VLGEWLQQKSIGPGVARARTRRKDADDKDEDVTGLGTCFQLTAERQTVKLRNEDLAQHEIGPGGANLLQRLVTVRRDLDVMARLGEEVGGKCPNVRVTLDDEGGE
jgi:hypothetical protein